MHNKNEWYTGITTVDPDSPKSDSQNFLMGLEYLDEFNRVVTVFLIRIEHILKRTVMVLGGFVAPQYQHATLYDTHTDNMRCVLLHLNRKEIDLLDVQAQQVDKNVYCVYL